MFALLKFEAPPKAFEHMAVEFREKITLFIAGVRFTLKCGQILEDDKILAAQQSSLP